MMKPFFKASGSAINIMRAPWFDMCTVWFVDTLSRINMTYAMPTCATSGTLPSGSVIINLKLHS